MADLYKNAAREIIKAGNHLESLQLAPATSGNYSIRTDDNEMAITVSGTHKGRLELNQIMRADLSGNSLDGNKPSAEILLHCLIYKLYPKVNAVLHTHSVACTVLTRLKANDDDITLSGYEMLKAFPDIDTHDTSVILPIFENTQDMAELSKRVNAYLGKHLETPAYLIRCHGLYGWGVDMDEAMRVIEATEMLLSTEMYIN